MSHLVDFYRGDGRDTEGRWLKDLWTWDDDRLEAVHDFIQWWFPLPEPSRFNPDAPLLSAEDITAFQDDEMLRANLGKSFARILTFLGLARAAEGQVVDGPNLAARAPDVWAAPNHNWLRLTRILRTLTLLGLADEARALYGWLEKAHRDRRFPIDANTFGYWHRALKP
jgi:hypothetical protein